MKRFRRGLAVTALVMGMSTLVKIPVLLISRLSSTPRRSLPAELAGRTAGALTLFVTGMPRFMASMFAPFAVATAALTSLISLLRRDWLAFACAEAGSWLLIRHFSRITQGHDEFTRAFGTGWHKIIPQASWNRVLASRWQLILPEPPAYRWMNDIRFGTHSETGRPLLCDIWQPPEGVPPSGVGMIYFHGSGWRVLDKDFGTRTFFRHIAAQGHVVMDVSYTLWPEAGMQGMLNDVRRAIAWLKTHAADYDVNPRTIVLCGGSAGAHLAMLAAFAPDHPALVTPDTAGMDVSAAGLISYYGIADLAAFHHRENAVLGKPRGRLIKYKAQEMVSRVIGGTPEDCPTEYALYSPITHIGAHCPPSLIFTGEDDAGVYAPEQGEPVAAALREAGVPVVYIDVPGAGHGFDLMVPRINPTFQTTLYDVDRFLALLQTGRVP